MHLTLDITPGLLAFSSEHKAPGPTTLRLRSVYSSTPGLRLKLQGPSAKNTKPPSGAHAFFPALLEIQLAHVRNPATYWSIFWSIGFFMNYGKLWQTMANYGKLWMYCWCIAVFSSPPAIKIIKPTAISKISTCAVRKWPWSDCHLIWSWWTWGLVVVKTTGDLFFSPSPEYPESKASHCGTMKHPTYIGNGQSQ